MSVLCDRLRRDLPRLPGATFDRVRVFEATFTGKPPKGEVPFGLKAPKLKIRSQELKLHPKT